MIYVAVVCKLWERSGRPLGDWACFINKNKNAAVQKAIKAKQHWERNGQYGPYKVLVGTLDAEATLPQQWRLQEIKEPVPVTRRSKCTCPPYYAAKDDAALADFCPVHGLDEYRSDNLNVAALLQSQGQRASTGVRGSAETPHPSGSAITESGGG